MLGRVKGYCCPSRSTQRCPFLGSQKIFLLSFYGHVVEDEATTLNCSIRRHLGCCLSSRRREKLVDNGTGIGVECDAQPGTAGRTVVPRSLGGKELPIIREALFQLVWRS